MNWSLIDTTDTNKSDQNSELINRAKHDMWDHTLAKDPEHEELLFRAVDSCPFLWRPTCSVFTNIKSSILMIHTSIWCTKRQFYNSPPRHMRRGRGWVLLLLPKKAPVHHHQPRRVFSKIWMQSWSKFPMAIQGHITYTITASPLFWPNEQTTLKTKYTCTFILWIFFVIKCH